MSLVFTQTIRKLWFNFVEQNFLTSDTKICCVIPENVYPYPLPSPSPPAGNSSCGSYLHLQLLLLRPLPLKIYCDPPWVGIDIRLFTVPYFSVILYMFDRPPSWCLEVEYEMPVGRSGKGRKNSETVTASLCLVFKGRGPILSPPLIKSINNLLPRRKKTCQIMEI